MELASRPKVIIVVGGPGAGKGTHCVRVAKEYGFVHLSIGDILRKEREFNTEEGKKLDEYMKDFEKTGRLMPCDVPIRFIMKHMVMNGWDKSVFLIDGLIKSVTMYNAWNKFFTKETVELAGVIYYKCSLNVMKKRILKRAQNSTRLDDANENLLMMRLKTFGS